MRRVRLIHWNAAEAKERVARLRAAGYRVVHEMLDGPAAVRRLNEDPGDAVVIDLDRLPAQGRDVALLLRRRKSTRHVPVVFVGGDPQKLPRVKKFLPDAEYTAWSRIRGSLRRAIARPPERPVVPGSSLAGYAGTPLPKKLGIKPNSVVVLLGEPRDFEKTLGRLPDGVALRRQARGKADRIVWFVRSCRELEGRVERVARALLDRGGLWIAWPKKTSGVASDLTQAAVRRIGLAAGLVDYKVAAIDATWSGLLFARRRAK